MPVVLIPLHFDRDPVDRKPSAQRSIVLRPFITSDWMTGMPVIPGSEKLPMDVSFCTMDRRGIFGIDQPTPTPQDLVLFCVGNNST